MKTKICTASIFLLAFTLFFSCGSSGDKQSRRSSAPVINDMVCVPAGWFWMGSEEGEQDERPVHRVWLDSFYMDRFPIINTQYGVFLRETGREKPLYWNDERCNGRSQPVVGISWADAMAYCSWRSKKEQAEFSLPTEAQWEKAARGDDKRKFPWGNQPPDKKRATTEITEKMPNVGVCDLGRSPYGVSDLVGNVWNWCRDWYDRDYYRKSPAQNPSGPPEAARKVVRGGNWVFLGCCSGTPAYAMRTSRRNSFHPSIQKKSIGFRCVKTGGTGTSGLEKDTVNHAP